MNTKTTEIDGKYYATVSAGDRVAHRTPAFYMEDMALAAAKCWVAFHEDVEMMWVPIEGGHEVELPRDDVQKIALEYAVVMRLDRQRENQEKFRKLRPLLNWVRETHGLTDRDMKRITHWWWSEMNSETAKERGRKAVEEFMAKRNS
ncbi:hypothetical protein [Streptomyces sp. SDr-06]|uniref:hypothetical protein n=1 Tax=Streptomyces sp. SDr-06 TaxID=2267702 RepID=UPI0011C07D40|nr:hypothetical protein [Streptomyces sp. SDr-06]